jgi:3-phosphoshikimate 1-carboxyvinyltransferase
MLSGILAGQSFTSILDGDQSLRGRPMGRILDPLTRMGASVTARDGNLPPIRIRGGVLRSIRFRSPVASAQVKSCVLFAGLYADGVTTVEEPAPSRNHTELMLSEFGARLSANEDGLITIHGPSELKPLRYSVPGDLSSAAFFMAAAALVPGSKLSIRRVGLNQTRTGFLDLLNWLGADVTVQNLTISHGERVGDLLVRAGSLKTGGEGLILSGSLIPNIIDEIPILAVVATQVEGRIEIRDAAELRVKESDRIKSVVNGLRSLGAVVEEFADGFAINGPQRLKGGPVECAGDHRIAMAFTVAGLLSSGSTEVKGSQCAGISFPGFYELLSSVTDEGLIRSLPA